MTDDITPRVLAEIAAQIEHPDAKPLAQDPTSFLRDDLGLYQVHIVAMAMGIEDALDCVLLDDVVHGWRTVADVIASARRAVALKTLGEIDGEVL